MSNTVEVNEEEIRDELKALEGEYIPAGSAGSAGPTGEGANSAHVGGESSSAQEPPAMDWTMPAGLIVTVFDKIVAPNWELEKEEKQILHAQIVGTLEAFFPTVNVDPRITALFCLGGTVVAIVGKRVDIATQTLKPMRPPKPEAEEVNADQARETA